MELKNIKGIGPVKIQKLANLGIISVKDIFFHFPYRYVDRKKKLKVNDLFLIDNENFHCIGEIEKLTVIRIGKGKQITNGYFMDDTGKIAITWFNNPYIISNYKSGDKVLISGKPDKKKLINPKMRKISTSEDIDIFARIESIYPETRGIKSLQINNFVKNAIEFFDLIIKDPLSKKIKVNEKLIDLKEAIIKIHFPNSQEDIDISRKRLAFDEIYHILKLVKKRKDKLKKFSSPVIEVNQALQNNLIRTLPFELTKSQLLALEEIAQDIQKNKPMHRLLNGDVGSGKTIIAALIASQFLSNKSQVIMLAPTGVLAKQHYDLFCSFFAKKDYNINLVTSSTKKEVDKLESRLKDSIGNELFIGTHALLYRLDLFGNAGLIIIDEQHKFGVEQRELLEKVTLKDSNNYKYLPHVLSMSATPIPRSLALTLYGDLEVSVLQKPVERKPIKTRCLYEEDTISKMYIWMEREIVEKKVQTYIVCPLIEESEKLDTKSAILEFENLKKHYPQFRIELLHGKIKSIEKDHILRDFFNKEIDILVSTSVIEVGINNPNATIMIIEGAERFGLAQLHQIRGRVGRSEKQSYCFIKTTNNMQNDRLNFFAENQDGFAISEYDLLSRGPGEVYGNTQSGLPKLKIANLFDIEFIKKVKRYL